MDPGRLKNIEVFSDLSDEELRKIASLAAETSVPQGEPLVRQGDFAYEMFAIEEGEVEVLRDGKVLATLKAGDVFGETAILEKELRNADVVAKTPVRVVVISRWDVRRLRKTLPDLDRHIQEVIERRKD